MLEAAIIGSTVLIATLTLGAFGGGGRGQVNLVPFRSVFDNVPLGDFYVGLVLFDMLANVALYVPLGIAVGLVPRPPFRLVGACRWRIHRRHRSRAVVVEVEPDRQGRESLGVGPAIALANRERTATALGAISDVLQREAGMTRVWIDVGRPASCRIAGTLIGARAPWSIHPREEHLAEGDEARGDQNGRRRSTIANVATSQATPNAPKAAISVATQPG